MASHSSAPSALSWTVVGEGAIGLLAASRLKLAKTAVCLWRREPAALDIQFIDLQLQQHSLHFDAALPAHASLQAILIPVKSYSVTAAVQQLLPYLAADAQLVLSHNGMGSIEQVLPLLQPQQGLWFATTTHGALKHSATSVQHTGSGQSILSAVNTAARHCQYPITSAMDLALGPLEQVSDIYPFLWQKLAVNAVINPLTAINNCRNGELQAEPYLPQIKHILHEVCLVATACGYRMDISSCLQKVLQVIALTSANYSSMQQDIAYQRPTEVNAINGYIVEKALNLGLNVPYNQQLQQQVLQLQQHYGR